MLEFLAFEALRDIGFVFVVRFIGLALLG